MAQCVFCETTANLNTKFVITLDDSKKVDVEICDTHAEDATVRTAKAAYVAKQAKAEELIAQLRAMGYQVPDANSKGLVVPTAPPAPLAKTAAAAALLDVGNDLEGENVVRTDVLDAKSHRGMVSIGGATNMGAVSSHNSHDTSVVASQLGPNALRGRAKLVVVEGREGMPLVIPEKRVDGTGTTRLKVVKTENDARLQTRFKKMATDSVQHDRTPDFARSGYQNTQRTCPICHGNCVIIQNKQELTCPKCNGSGTISVY